MKLELLCPACAKRLKKVVGDGSKICGQHVVYKEGAAKRNPWLLEGISYCDHCIEPLPEGHLCTATTSWNDPNEKPRPWEFTVITLLN